jgi:hypothetical protein
MRRMTYFGLYLGMFPIATIVSAFWSTCRSGATFTIHASRR